MCSIFFIFQCAHHGAELEVCTLLSELCKEEVLVLEVVPPHPHFLPHSLTGTHTGTHWPYQRAAIKWNQHQWWCTGAVPPHSFDDCTVQAIQCYACIQLHGSDLEAIQYQGVNLRRPYLPRSQNQSISSDLCSGPGGLFIS